MYTSFEATVQIRTYINISVPHETHMQAVAVEILNLQMQSAVLLSNHPCERLCIAGSPAESQLSLSAERVPVIALTFTKHDWCNLFG